MLGENNIEFTPSPDWFIVASFARVNSDRFSSRAFKIPDSKMAEYEFARQLGDRNV